MSQSVLNNRKILKNTAFLYIRMILLMCIALYTSRVVLYALGDIGFGIYTVVGGIVGMLGFLNNSMANAVQRFLSFEMGKGHSRSVSDIFCISMIGHLVIICIVFIGSEAIGLWLLNDKLDIPADRFVAAHWVLQTSILIALLSFLQVPYNAIILSSERMGIYAYISLLEAGLRLGIALTILQYAHDRLILYSILQLAASLIITFTYYAYCRHKIPESRFHWITDIKKFKEIFSFVSFNLIGEISQVFTGQGLSILLNMFFGPAINAARGVAGQVNDNVSKFINNFQQAMTPQIIKTYANEELSASFSLTFRGIKFSYFLFYALSLPLLLEMEQVLSFWLKQVPPYSAAFCRIVLLASMIGCCSGLLSQLVRANGNIKMYQIICSIGGLISLPVGYIMLQYWHNPIYTMTILIGVQVLLFFSRVFMTSHITGMSKVIFVREAIFPIFFVSVISIIVPFVWHYFHHPSVSRFVLTVIIAPISVIATAYFIGMTSQEKLFVKNLAIKLIKRS